MNPLLVVVAALAVAAAFLPRAAYAEQSKPGRKTSVVVYSQKPWNDTGVRLQQGRRYRLTARVPKDEVYKDSSIVATPDGVSGPFGRFFDSVAREAKLPFNPIRWFGPGKIKRLRVLSDRHGRRATFLTLIAAIGRDDRRENVYVIGSGAEFTAHKSGELVLFSNDWPGGRGTEGEERFACSGSYKNNRGRLLVRVEAL